MFQLLFTRVKFLILFQTINTFRVLSVAPEGFFFFFRSRLKYYKLCVCMCMHVCVLCVCVHTCICLCRLEVQVGCFPLFTKYLRKGLSLNLNLPLLLNWLFIELWNLFVCIPSVRVIDELCHTWPYTWVLGMLVQQGLYPLNDFSL